KVHKRLQKELASLSPNSALTPREQMARVLRRTFGEYIMVHAYRDVKGEIPPDNVQWALRNYTDAELRDTALLLSQINATSQVDVPYMRKSTTEWYFLTIAPKLPKETARRGGAVLQTYFDAIEKEQARKEGFVGTIKKQVSQQ